MRISDPNNSRAVVQSQRISTKIQKFPLSTVSQKISDMNNSGTVISISNHARKIQEQNESILKQALSEEIGARRIFDIRAKMENGYYTSREISEKIAEGIMAEAALFT